MRLRRFAGLAAIALACSAPVPLRAVELEFFPSIQYNQAGIINDAGILVSVGIEVD